MQTWAVARQVDKDRSLLKGRTTGWSYFGFFLRMKTHLVSLSAAFLVSLVLSGCVTGEAPKSSLSLDTQSSATDLAVTNTDLPMDGPAPQSRPDILALASGSSTAEPKTNAKAAPDNSLAMLEPDTKKSDTPKLEPVAKIAETAQPVVASNRERNCLMRVMYFESNRSSPDGLLAVGTVVMHRLQNGAWGNSVCSVVQARSQFAPGLMTRQMQGNLSDLQALADNILAGKRHPTLAKNVMFFHVAGMKFPYKNMRYVLVAGGNTFYYKAQRKRRA